MSIDVVTYLRNLASPDPYDERPTPHAKELYQAADEIETLRKQLRTEKDSHLSTGHTIGAKAQSLFLELATSQAYSQQLRDALRTLASCTAREGAYGRALQKTISEALTLPQDDTALRQWGAKLLREMAQMVWGANDPGYFLKRKADELEGKK